MTSVCTTSKGRVVVHGLPLGVTELCIALLPGCVITGGFIRGERAAAYSPEVLSESKVNDDQGAALA